MYRHHVRVCATGVTAAAAALAVVQLTPAAASTVRAAIPAGVSQAADRLAGPAGPPGAATISTVRTGNSYAVYINGHRKALVTDQSPFYSIRATVTGSGSLAAVVPDFDGLSGSGLLILDARSGKMRTLAHGPVTSAAFTASGTRLAYAVQGHGSATVFTGTPDSPGHRVASVPGLDVSVLGWGSDGRSVFATVYPDRRAQTNLPPDLVRVDTETARVIPVLTSDVTHHLAYRDFRLVRIDGQQLVSFIRSGTGYACANQPSVIGLATLTGRVVRTFGRTHDTYTEAVWSSDGRQVAYTELACPTAAQMHSAAGKTAFARRAVAVAGTYVAGVPAGPRTEVVKGISGFGLAGLDRGIMAISHDRFGVRTVSAAAVAAGRAAPLRAAALQPKPKIAAVRPITFGRHPRPVMGAPPRALTNSAGFVNQVYDTPDAFDGRGSCGPSSSVMDLAGYQLSAWPMWVYAGGYHETDYGQYVTGVYTYGSTTYSWTEPDYSGAGAWAGAHGFMFIPGVGSPWSGGWGIYDYLNNHTGWAQLNGGFDPGTVQNQLNWGYLVPAGGTVHGLSHVILVKGYTDDGGFVVNDPYGPNTDGGWGGADQVYYLGSDMSLWNSVAN
ncbi:MAG TPA: hypothetical protein VGS19_06935 [Streptosporangiaceae bacterium]|nr:hypothetical protein [Streptosporangiaceae bacterium]